MNFVKKLAAAALLASTMIFTGCGQGQVGSVDLGRVMEEAPRVKTLMTEAEGKLTEVQQNFEKEYANKTDMTEEEAMKAQMDMRRKLDGINQAYTSQIQNRLNVVIEEIAREKNIDVVISNTEGERLIFHGAIDVTDDVIKKMQ